MDRHLYDFSLGQDGAIENFLDDIFNTVKESSHGCVLELGVAHGTGSTVAIYEGLKHAVRPLHVSVELYPENIRWRPPVEWWRLVEGDSLDALTAVQAIRALDGRTPGVIFIDTVHDYTQMSQELPIWSELAGDETVWLFHDTAMFSFRNDEMIRAIEEFAAANGWVYDDWRPQAHGLGRMRRYPR